MAPSAIGVAPCDAAAPRPRLRQGYGGQAETQRYGDTEKTTDLGETVFDAAEIAWDYREEILEVLAKHGVVRPEENDVEES